MEFEPISQEDIGWLERPFVKVEIFEVIKDMKGNKALKRDGLSISIFQKC